MNCCRSYPLVAGYLLLRHTRRCSSAPSNLVRLSYCCCLALFSAWRIAVLLCRLTVGVGLYKRCRCCYQCYIFHYRRIPPSSFIVVFRCFGLFVARLWLKQRSSYYFNTCYYNGCVRLRQGGGGCFHSSIFLPLPKLLFITKLIRGQILSRNSSPRLHIAEGPSV